MWRNPERWIKLIGALQNQNTAKLDMYTHFFGSAVSVKIMDMFVIDHFVVEAEYSRRIMSLCIVTVTEKKMYASLSCGAIQLCGISSGPFY